MSPNEWKSCAKSFTRLFPCTQRLSSSFSYLLLYFSSFSPSVSSSVLSSVPASNVSLPRLTFARILSRFFSPVLRPILQSEKFLEERKKEGETGRKEKEQRGSKKSQVRPVARSDFRNTSETTRPTSSLAFLPFSRPFYLFLPSTTLLLPRFHPLAPSPSPLPPSSYLLRGSFHSMEFQSRP